MQIYNVQGGLWRFVPESINKTDMSLLEKSRAWLLNLIPEKDWMWITDPYIYIFITILFTWFFYKERGKLGAFLDFIFVAVVTGVGDLIINLLIKPGIGRVKPFVNLADPNVHVIYSFPSSHVFNMIVVVMVFWLLYRARGFKKYDTVMAVCGTLAVVIVALSRLALFQHFPIDVFFGALTGGIYTWLVFHPAKKLHFRLTGKKSSN